MCNFYAKKYEMNLRLNIHQIISRIEEVNAKSPLTKTFAEKCDVLTGITLHSYNSESSFF